MTDWTTKESLLDSQHGQETVIYYKASRLYINSHNLPFNVYWGSSPRLKQQNAESKLISIWYLVLPTLPLTPSWQEQGHFDSTSPFSHHHKYVTRISARELLSRTIFTTFSKVICGPTYTCPLPRTQICSHIHKLKSD